MSLHLQLRLLVALLGFFSLSSVCTADDKLKGGFPLSSFKDQSVSDARVAAEFFLDQAFNAAKTDYTGYVYETEEELLEALSRNQIDFTIINSELFMTLAEYVNLTPILVSVREKHPLERLVLVCRENTQFSDLEYQSLVIDHSARGGTPLRWITDHLLRSGIGKPAEEYFSGIQQVNSASKAVLPVYFGRSEAAIVSEADFRLMCEYNPNIDARLQVVARSKPLTYAVLCVPSNKLASLSDKNLTILKNLHRSEEGLHFLKSLAATKFIPFKEEYLLYNQEIHNRTEGAKSDLEGAR